MKLMWVCNTLLPEAAKLIGLGNSKPESWISAIYEDISKSDSIHLVYLYPCAENKKPLKAGNTTFESYYAEGQIEYSQKQVCEFKNLIKQYDPDVIHVFGTEFPHTLAFINACIDLGCIDKVVVSIQGLVSVYSTHYYAYLPSKIVNRKTFRDIIRHDSIKRQRDKYEQRGKFEIAAIRKAKNVIGRTDWDYACTKRINPDITYYKCNETLRKSFLCEKNKWNIHDCEKHSIFFSQWYSPLKGLHLAIEALAELVKTYPDAHMYTTGTFDTSYSVKNCLKLSSYKKYLFELIYKYNLQDKITFLGYLGETEMCERMRNSSVFVCASSIENSPNSVGEAMALGVPTVSSDVGGVKNLMEHGKEGFVYQADAPYMLAYYVDKIWSDDDLALELSQNAQARARVTHDPQKNLKTLMAIYNDIVQG